ncbi:MAG: hypothetical protein HC898_09675 [Phycisphaerales bacterium]|nr:hypothetical protein [Phycisphaerales bacterium]
MSRISTNIPRTTTMQSMNTLLSNLRRTQKNLFDAQNQVQTGLLVAKPSDAPSKTSAILLLQATLEARAQQKLNLAYASSIMANVDHALADTTDILQEAQSIGSSQIGIGSSSDTRKNQATVIDGQITALVDIANRQHQGVSLFGGNFTPGAPGSLTGDRLFVFDSQLGGVRYSGTIENLKGDLGFDEPVGINSNGHEAFTAMSARVVGDRDLDPLATANTRLEDLNGARGLGVTTGALELTVNGVMTSVDLTTAQTMGDVMTRLNDAINQLDPAAGALSITAQGFTLTASAGYTISMNDTLTGTTAADLGLAISAAGASVAGGDVDPRLSLFTSLTALGVSVDTAGGLKVSQGGLTKTLDLTGATTVQDLINRMTALDMGLRMGISPDGSGLQLISEISGPAFSIGEVAGGTTATDLGIRSFSRSTTLDELNFGIGIHRTAGEDDFRVSLHDGSSFDVNLDGAISIGDVIDKVRNAAEIALGAGNVGSPGDAGTLFNIGLALDGNGLAFEDGTAGGQNFRISALGTSLAASDLGILKDVSSGSNLVGDDVAKVRVEGVFTHMINLRDALVKDDSRGITLATAALGEDVSRRLGFMRMSG